MVGGCVLCVCQLPALERRRRREGVRLTVPAALALSWLALTDDEDAGRALAYLRVGKRDGARSVH